MTVLIKSIDEFLDRVPSATYNCHDFVREVWLKMTGEDVTDRMTRIIGEFVNRRIVPSNIKSFEILEVPDSPCFIIMQRSRFVPHVGIYFEDRVLHLADHGAEYMPLVVAKRYFTRIRYYR